MSLNQNVFVLQLQMNERDVVEVESVQSRRIEVNEKHPFPTMNPNPHRQVKKFHQPCLVVSTVSKIMSLFNLLKI